MSHDNSIRCLALSGLERRPGVRFFSSRNLAVVLAAFGFLAATPPVPAADNGLGKTPLMGWSSWQAFKSGISASTTKGIADAMTKQLPGQPAGVTLQSVGYVYVNVDSGWRVDGAVDANGYEVPDTSANKFPGGIKPLADYVHNLGLKFGLYLHPGLIIAAYNANAPIVNTNPVIRTKAIADTSIPGNTSTGKSQAYKIIYSRNGAVQYIQGYANLLANTWTVDYMKFDFVGPGGGNVAADNRDDMQQWLTAFENTGRPVWVELSNSLKVAYGSTWKVVSNGARIDGDIESGGGPSWSNISKRFSDSPAWISFEGATANGGFWGDMDSLPIGDGTTVISNDEKKTAMTLWSICCSPLIIGRDIRKITSGEAALLANTEVIGVDQAGHVATPGSTAGVWRSINPDGTRTVGIFNTTGSTITGGITVDFPKDLLFSGSATVRDLWTHTDLGTFNNSFNSGSLASHACRLLTITPVGTQQVAAPVFSPAGGTYAIAQNVTITSATGGASIRYTTDGSMPTETHGTVYSGPVNIASSVTLQAIAYESGFSDSTVTSAGYTINPQPRVADPVFSPASGTPPLTVTITSATAGATIRYTTDGSTPGETAGTVYSGAVSISGATTLKAIAYEAGFTDSNVTSASYGSAPQTFNFEAENLSYTGSGATTSVQTDTNSSGGKWVELAGNSVGDHIDFTVPGIPAGTYQVQMKWKGNNTRGILQLSVDGANLGSTLDQYASGQTYPTTTFGNVTFSAAGSHTVTLTVTGKNSASSGEILSADKFTLVGQ